LVDRLVLGFNIKDLVDLIEEAWLFHAFNLWLISIKVGLKEQLRQDVAVADNKVAFTQLGLVICTKHKIVRCLILVELLRLLLEVNVVLFVLFLVYMGGD
jgi:hypothetical protein